MTAPRTLLLYALLAAGACGAGWLRGRGMVGTLKPEPPATLVLPGSSAWAQTPWNAPVAEWQNIWKLADSAAERAVLMEAWNARNPEALLHFLRRLPPLTVLRQNDREKEALLIWSDRAPVAAFDFACRHHEEYQVVDAILRSWLVKDLKQGLDLLNSRLLPAEIQPGDCSWIRQNPALACPRLVQMRDRSQRNAFVSAACRVWAGDDPSAAIQFAQSQHGETTGVALGGVVEVIPIPQAAFLLEKFDRPQWTTPAAAALATRWAAQDFPAALKWSMENLPPSSGSAARYAIGLALGQGSKVPEAALADSLNALPPWAWRDLLTSHGNTQPWREASSYSEATLTPELARRLVPYARDKEIISSMLRALRFEPDNPPAWFSTLPEEQAGRILNVKEQ